MKRFLSTRVKIVLLITVVVTAALLIIGSLAGLSFPNQVVKSILAPFRAGVSAMTDGAQKVYSYIFEFDFIKYFKLFTCNQ